MGQFCNPFEFANISTEQMIKISYYLVSLITFLVIDGIWLAFMSKAFYAKQLAHLMASKPNWTAALIFYLIYAVAIASLVVQPAISQNLTNSKIVIYGAILGLAAYGAYDLTNQATLKNWPYIVTLVDLIWGAVVTALTAVIAIWIIKNRGW